MTGLGPSGIDEGLDAWERDYADRTAAARAQLCASEQHYYRRDGDVWACTGCPATQPYGAARDAS